MRGILPIGGVHRSRDRLRATGHVDMRRAAGMPELGEHLAALAVDRVGDRLPARNLGIGIEAGRAEPTSSRGRHRGGFADDQPALGGALAVIGRHEGTGDVAGLGGPRPRERGHDDAVAQSHGADLYWGQQLGHRDLLEREALVKGSSADGRRLPMRLEVAVPALRAAPERLAVVGRQRQVAPQALGKVGVRGEEPTEGDDVGIAAPQDRLRP